MAALHSALQSLAPVKFKDVPPSTDEQGLQHYIAELHANAQTIVESIPIADPDELHSRPRSKTTSSIASNSSEISASSARSEPPPPHIVSLQKEWGKPLKLKPSENVLGISVYKTSGKDGRGSWFARRSVHEGLGFARFKHAFEQEFPTSLAVQGAPGQGNIRGIGAEARIENIDVPNRGTIDVYRLSAQFPGPTTPRDFVTFLVSSSRAIKHYSPDGKVPEITPRHFMIISKPCDHPKTQPRDGFIRGQYESVEFIREVPRKLKTSASQTNLHDLGHHHHHPHEHDMAQDMLIRNAGKLHSFPIDQNEIDRKLLHPQHSDSRDTSPSGRKRSQTVGVAEPSREHHESVQHDPEDNPVEWIMVTRSDPGGSVPRFLVERGTPSSICADAVKFLDWACQQDDEIQSPTSPARPVKAFRRESLTSFDNEQHLEQVKGTLHSPEQVNLDSGQEIPPSRLTSEADHDQEADSSKQESAAPDSQGMVQTIGGVLSAFVPQFVAGHLSGDTPRASPRLSPVDTVTRSAELDGAVSRTIDDDDAASTYSSISWISAESHVTSASEVESQSISSQQHSLSSTQPSNQFHDAHEKELLKLSQRKEALDKKFAQQREKLNKHNATASEKEQIALKKAEEKHQRELKKHEERFQRELKKLEERKKKDAAKAEEKKRKQADKDEKEKLRRERDEALEKLHVLEQEREVFLKKIGEMQKENTMLTARLGRLEGHRLEGHALESGGSRSRSNSVLRKKRDDDLNSHAHT